jgi:hypothetical protein
MRKELFKRAKWFIDNQKIKIVAETNNSIRFEIEGTELHNVELRYQNYEMLKLCDCKHGSLRTTCEICHRSPECSHILAALAFLTNGNTKQEDYGSV